MTTAIIQDVTMTYGSALNIANAIEDKRLDFNGMRGTLENLVDSLSGQWEGTAQREFLTAYNKLKPKLQLINETMERYSNEIKKTVAEEQEQDQASSSGLRGIESWFMQGSSVCSNRGSRSLHQTSGKNISADSDEQTNDNAEQIPVVQKENAFGNLVPSSMGGYYSIGGAEQYIKRQPYSGPCMAYAFSMGLSIVEGRDVDPWQYWNSSKGYAEPDTSKLSDYWIPANATTILEQLKSRKPVLLHVSHSGYGGEHWVTVCGTNNPDSSDVSISDFLFMDPGNGTIRSYDEMAGSYPNMTPDYMDLFK